MDDAQDESGGAGTVEVLIRSASTRKLVNSVVWQTPAAGGRQSN